MLVVIDCSMAHRAFRINGKWRRDDSCIYNLGKELVVILNNFLDPYAKPLTISHHLIEGVDLIETRIETMLVKLGLDYFYSNCYDVQFGEHSLDVILEVDINGQI